MKKSSAGLVPSANILFWAVRLSLNIFGTFFFTLLVKIFIKHFGSYGLHRISLNDMLKYVPDFKLLILKIFYYLFNLFFPL